jgi:hypothetical protein
VLLTHRAIHHAAVDWPAEFARFELSILDPGIHDPLSTDQLAKLEKILECELRQVRAHY